MTIGKLTFIGNGRSDITISLSDTDAAMHTLILRGMGRGRSSLIEADAARRGVSYAEAEKDWLPTEAEQRAAAERERAAQAKRDLRTAAVREAYWASTDPESGEFDSLHGALREVYALEPTGEQVRKLYNILPAELIGEAVKWGFTDTAVGDSIYEFVRESKAEVLAAIMAT